MKKCKCGNEYQQFTSLQNCCIDCLALKVQKTRINSAKVAQKHENRELIRQKEAIKSRSDWMKEAQQAFNAWRRTEDGNNRGGECISCGTIKGKQNAGHYRSVGSSPELRFEPLNVWLQCEKCNTYLHSNAIEFRISLLKIIGHEKLVWLEGKHEARHYSIDDLKALKSLYKQKLKDLK